jgi:hypothetical protein
MNKNTKSRVIRAADAVVICVCLLGTAAFLYLFQADLNQSFRRLNEEPVGVIASRTKAAMRRLRDRNIWDRLRKDSAVYSGDFIRTAESAEAAIGFPDGTLVGISENSLIRVFMDEGIPRFDFSRGNISVHAGETGSLVSFGGNQVRAAAGSVLSLDAETGEDGNFSIQVIEGDASLITPDGEREAAAGTTVSLNAEGMESEVFRLSVIEPPPAARFFAPSDAPVPVPFVWNSPAGSEVPVRVEIARNRDFTRSLTVLEAEPAGGIAGTSGVSSEITAALPPGTWWWRISRPENSPGEVEASGQFTVIYAPPPAPVSPAPEAVYHYLTTPPELRFQWEAPGEASYYLLEAADNPDMINPALRTEVRYNSLVHSSLAEGRWYWRVTPVFSALYRGTAPASPVVPFTIVHGDPPARLAEAEEAVETALELPVEPAPPPVEPPPPPVPPPVPVKPVPPPPLPMASGRKPEGGYVINHDILRESRTIVFSWDPVAEADAYIFTLFHEAEPGRRRSIVSSESPETSYTLEDLSLLDLGRFVWQVEAVSREADGRRGIPGENLFTVDIPQPDTPRGRAPEALDGK